MRTLFTNKNKIKYNCYYVFDRIDKDKMFSLMKLCEKIKQVGKYFKIKIGTSRV